MRLDEATSAMGGEFLSCARPNEAGARGAEDLEIRDLAYDSRRAAPGTLFFCIRGAHFDGHEFAQDAAQAGASALVCEQVLGVPVPQVVVGDSLTAMNRLASPFFGDPSSRMDVIGVTGTNGKTTTTYLLDSIFRSAGATSGLIGTVQAKIGSQAAIPAGRTTPESIDLQRLFADMVQASVTKCAMEVTSVGLERGRVAGTRFGSVLFTNLTQDHLDDHGDMESYYRAKRRLFSPEFSSTAAINVDDPHGRRLLQETELDVLTFGMGPDCDLRAEKAKSGPGGSIFRARGPGVDCDIHISLPGRYNILNGLAAMAGALLGGIELEAVAQGLSRLRMVPGRMERLSAGQNFHVIVDYAHTPAALEALLAGVREIAPEGRLILVFGCGGDRDRTKRPLMGKAAGAADFVIATSDNPRSEDPLQILSAVKKGLDQSPPREGYLVMEDRRSAIGEAIERARPGDAVVLAGKGHETGQTVKGVTHPFDDREVALEALKAGAVG